jgi:hypothetical protein
VSKDNKAVPKDNKAVPKDDSAVPTGGVAEPSAAPASKGDPAQLWPQVVDALTGFPKALFKPASVVSVDGDTVTISVPSNTPMPKVQESASKLQATIQKVCGVKYTLVFTQDPTASRGIERPRVINNVLDDEPIETMDPADIENSVEVPPMNDVDELYKAFPGGSVQDS